MIKVNVSLEKYNPKIERLAKAYESWRWDSSHPKVAKEILIIEDERDFIVEMYRINVRRDIKSHWYEVNPTRMKLCNNLWKILKEYYDPTIEIKWEKATVLKRIIG